MPTLTELKNIFQNLSPDEKQEFLILLSSDLSKDEQHFTLDESRFSDGLYCPHCGCTEKINKNGKYKDKQRYLCKNCGSSFMASTKTILHCTKRSLSTWRKYINCILDGLSIRKSSQLCKISIKTSFFWRH